VNLAVPALARRRRPLRHSGTENRGKRTR
jgi:hypothetical protein